MDESAYGRSAASKFYYKRWLESLHGWLADRLLGDSSSSLERAHVALLLLL